MNNLKFLINSSCNLRCSFCHNEFQGDTRGIRSDRQQLYCEEQVKSIFDFYNRSSQLFNIKFSGGEPLLSPYEIYKILRLSKDYNIPNKVVLSNLTLAKREIYRNLIDLGVNEFRINIPSFNSKEYSRMIRRSENFLSVAIGNARYLKQNDIYLRLNSVISLTTIDDLKPFIVEYLDATLSANCFDHVTFIIDDRSLIKSDLYKGSIETLKDISSIPVTIRRGRIYQGRYKDINVDVSKCDLQDYDEIGHHDIYISPPGTVVNNFVKGRAYND